MKWKRKIFPALGVALLSFCLGTGGVRANETASQSEVLEIPFEKYQLDNGLEVILHQDHSLPLVAVSVWYHVGAFHEPEGRSGFAHLFEHMMFQGSKHVKDDAHFGILERIGATSINGTTDYDRTNYFETVPSNYLETALWLESDRMGFLIQALTEEKLSNQKDVVKNERRQGVENSPYELGEEKLWHALFPRPHPYFGKVIGSMEDIGAASLDDVRSFFETWYAPSNATLTLAGDFQKDEAKRLVEKYFGSLKKSEAPPAVEVGKVTLDKEVVIEHEETIGQLAKVMVAWHSPAFFQEGDGVADILSDILTSGKSSKLHKSLVRELEVAQSVQSYQYSLGAQSVFVIEAVARKGVDPKSLLQEIDKTLASVREGDIKVEEIARAVSKFETDFFTRLQTLGGFGGKAEKLQLYNHFLKDPGYLAKDLERYRKVKKESVIDFTTNVLSPEKRVVLFAIPADPSEVKDQKEAPNEK